MGVQCPLFSQEEENISECISSGFIGYGLQLISKRIFRLCWSLSFSPLEQFFFLFLSVSVSNLRNAPVNLATDQMHHIISVYSTIHCIGKPIFCSICVRFFFFFSIFLLDSFAGLCSLATKMQSKLHSINFGIVLGCSAPFLAFFDCQYL